MLRKLKRETLILSDMEQTKFKAYAAAFQSGGAAALCLDYISTKLHGKLAEDWAKFYEEEIRKQTDEAEPDEAEIVEEIESNLMSLPDEKSCETYLFDVITAFSDWGNVLYPKAEITRLGEEIRQYKDIYNQWWNDAKANKNEREKQMAACSEMVAKREEEIGKLQKEADEIRRQINQDEYAHCWEISFRWFVGRLDAMLLKHGIDLMRLQEECGVYLQTERDLFVVADILGSIKLAKKYIDAIQKKREPQQEEAKPVLVDDTQTIRRVFGWLNGEIWHEIGIADFLMMMQTGDLSNLSLKTNCKTKMKKILGGIRLTIADKDKSNQWCANVKNTIDIDAKRDTPNVSAKEIRESAGLEEFRNVLSKIFTVKTK